MRDMFGIKLWVGDVVVYADGRDESSVVSLDLYTVVNLVDDVVTGERMSGDAMGEYFYLEDTKTRACILRNVYNNAALYQNQILN